MLDGNHTFTPAGRIGKPVLFARLASGFQKAGGPFRHTSSNVHFSNAATQTHLMVLKMTFSGKKWMKVIRLRTMMEWSQL